MKRLTTPAILIWTLAGRKSDIRYKIIHPLMMPLMMPLMS
jgi:hypothetical protein